MSVPKAPSKVLLFTAVLFPADFDIKELLDLLSKKIAGIKITSIIADFLWTDYYEKEMGSNLKRLFVVYDGLFERDSLVDFKKITDAIEIDFAKENKRVLNIDPGIICLENILLATNKPFFHRIYLSQGVYAEVTLYYKKGSYHPIEYWTFPEYRANPLIMFFNQVRGCLK